MTDHYPFIETLERTIRRSRRNPTCVYPGCTERPIASHVLARKTLELLSDQGHVLTWVEASSWDMIRGLRAGQSLEQRYEEPTTVGIGEKNKVTFPLFCKQHDAQVFAPLERAEFAFQPVQIALLAYRALCSMTLGLSTAEHLLRVAQEHGYNLSWHIPERYQRLQRFLASDLMVNVRQFYGERLSSNDFSQLGWAARLVNVPFCLASTYALIPAEDGEALAIIDGSQSITIEDAICFSFLPYKPLQNSICVISWRKGSRRAYQFLESHSINTLSEQELNDLFLSSAFESPMIYLSPQWWQSLSEEKRAKYKRIRREAGRRHADFV